MRFELDISLVQGRGYEEPLILGLLSMAWNGRHRTIATKRSEWDSWANTLAVSTREWVMLALDISEEMDARGTGLRPDFVVRHQTADIVRQGGRHWVSTEFAVNIASRPFRVVLENGRYDRDFLLAFADSARRSELERQEERGWLRFETAGGIEGLLQQAKHVANSRWEPWRTWFMCDSDAKEVSVGPGGEKICSGSANNVGIELDRICRQLKIPKNSCGKVLERRAAENYAPLRDLVEWSRSKIGDQRLAKTIEQEFAHPHRTALTRRLKRETRVTVLRFAGALAFREIPMELRAVYDMKLGRGTGPDKIRTSDHVWDTFPEEAQLALALGFGKNFSADFYSNRRELVGETAEISDIIDSILERR